MYQPHPITLAYRKHDNVIRRPYGPIKPKHDYFFFLHNLYISYVCRATAEQTQQKSYSNGSSSTAIDVPNSSSPTIGAYVFGRFFSFGTTPPAFTVDNPLAAKAANLGDVNHNI
ncbi:unnamed protein product [Rotaria magnacalcarata]|uniref:Uncharacterized protein n=1 Tax=Rotaria magnacalcarata TaxID=392030 RepID=A0A815KEL3_9BILA|nr:unnamed protein product [Rotaria magnacalcarata]